MTKLSESINASQLAAALDHGLTTLDLQQTITLKKYTRSVIPLDGFVYWVPMGEEITVQGSLHYTQEIQQSVDEIQGLETITFTSKEKVVEFETSPIETLYVGEVDGFRYAFSSQQGFYTQASLWHYFGHSISPGMASTLLDVPGMVDPSRATVSNSIPLWLAFNSYKSQFYDGFTVDQVPFFKAPPTLYPSMQSPPNLVPPYGVVDIDSRSPQALQSVPYVDKNRSHWQLVSDDLQVILYGLQHNEGMDLIDAIMEYSVNTKAFGIMNSPVVRDFKRNQVETINLAQLKVIDFKISYNQARVISIARQLILEAIPKIYIAEYS